MSLLDAVLVAINTHWREYCVPPTIRYITDQVHTSPSVVHGYYRKLVQAGEIKLAGGPGADPKPVPTSLFKLIKENLPHERSELPK